MRIPNIYYLLLVLILAIYVLSSCTESKYPRYYQDKGHTYKLIKSEEFVSVLHSVECEKRDMIELLDSLNSIPK